MEEVFGAHLDVILFLGHRGLAFHGSFEVIGDPQNISFLGLIELISHYVSLITFYKKSLRKKAEDK